MQRIIRAYIRGTILEAGFRLNLHDFFFFSYISIISRRNRLVPTKQPLSTPLFRNTERWNTRARSPDDRFSLTKRQRMRRGSGGLAIGTELRLSASSSVTRFPLHPRVCPLFPASLTSLLDGHASLCLPWNAIQTAKQPGIETTCLCRGAGSN